MRKIELDGRKMDSRVQAHSYLRHMLMLPEHYGANLDALADCLGEMNDVLIVLTHKGAMMNALGEYGARLIEVFKSAGADRTHFNFRDSFE